MEINVRRHVTIHLSSAFSLSLMLITGSLNLYSHEINISELKQVTATGWMSDGTKGSVDSVEIEAFGLKNAAQDIARLINRTPKSKLNFTPDLSTLLSAYTLKIKLISADKQIIIRLITSHLISMDYAGNEVFFRLEEDDFEPNAFIPSLEKLFFSNKKGYWIKMKEVERLKNEF